ncbi:MAG: pyruvate kinase [Phycisphaerales bacterium]
MNTPIVATRAPRLARPTLAGIVATIGPASESPALVRRLVEAGVSVFRLNFSHGTEEEHTRRLRIVREAAQELGVPVALLGDLQGPKIRIGIVPDPGIDLAPGQDVLIDPTIESAIPGPTPRLGCSVKSIGLDVQPGHKVLINDGAIRLLAVDRANGDGPSALRCRVVVGGLVTSRKGLNTPQSTLSVPTMTERDWGWVRWSVANAVDFLALSFVRCAAEVLELKLKLAEMAAARGEADGAGEVSPIPVVAKMETPSAVEQMEAIIQASDAIMVARGDLGVELDLAVVPIVQKQLIACSATWGKPCIVATQMLESMITAGIPSRAEASDVANAIFDGADAVMLSGETAVGKHPVLVVETMRRIVLAAEAQQALTGESATPPARIRETHYRTAALAHAAWHAAKDFDARAIVCWSQNGGSARYLSQTGTRIPIVAYSSSAVQTRRMALLKGVTPIHAQPPVSGLAGWNRRVEQDLQARSIAGAGDNIVLVAGAPLGVPRSPNTMALHTIGDVSSGFLGL